MKTVYGYDYCWQLCNENIDCNFCKNEEEKYYLHKYGWYNKNAPDKIYATKKDYYQRYPEKLTLF